MQCKGEKPRRELEKWSGHANLGCSVLWKLGISDNGKYFLKTQPLDPWLPRRELRTPHRQTQNQLPAPCPTSRRCPHRLGPLCQGRPQADSRAQLPVAMATFQLALHSDRDARLCNKVLCKGLHVFGRDNSAFFFTWITLGAVRRDLASHFPCLGLRPWVFLEGTSWQLFIFLFPNIPSLLSWPLPAPKERMVFPLLRALVNSVCLWKWEEWTVWIIHIPLADCWIK